MFMKLVLLVSLKDVWWKIVSPNWTATKKLHKKVAGSTPLRVAFKRRAYTLARRLVQLHADLDQAHRLPEHLGSVLEGKWDPGYFS